MKLGTENKRQMILAGVLGACALPAMYFLYQDLFGGAKTPPPPPPVIRDASPAGAAGTETRAPIVGVNTGAKAAVKVGTSAAALDPTLHMEGMLRAESLVYTGSGRNIFSSGPALTQVLTPIPKAIEPARIHTPIPVPPQVIVQGPPPINLRFFGTATSPNGTRRAFLVNGDNVFIASAGDVVERRYRILSISANSISVEDMPNSNKQTLPLLAN